MLIVSPVLTEKHLLISMEGQAFNIGANHYSYEVCCKATEASKEGFVVVSASCAQPGTSSISKNLKERQAANVWLIKVELKRKSMGPEAFDFYHDYLMLTVEPFEFHGRKMIQPLLVRAEKVRVSPLADDAGGPLCKHGYIRIIDIMDEKADVEVAFVAEMGNSGLFLLSSLLSTLKSSNPAYDLAKNNYWWYAYVTLKKLINQMLELSDTSPETKRRL